MKFDDLEGLSQALFQESADALFLFDPETEQILDVNSPGQRLTGFPLRDMLKAPITSLFRCEGPGDVQGLLQASRKTGVSHRQDGFLIRTVSDRAWIPVSLSTSRLHLKPKPLGLVTARDVRDQRAAHARLAETEAEQRRIIAAVSDCLWSAEVAPSGQWTFRYL